MNKFVLVIFQAFLFSASLWSGAFHDAVRKKDYKLLQELALDISDVNLNERDESGRTALDLAYELGDLKAAKLLTREFHKNRIKKLKDLLKNAQNRLKTANENVQNPKTENYKAKQAKEAAEVAKLENQRSRVLDKKSKTELTKQLTNAKRRLETATKNVEESEKKNQAKQAKEAAEVKDLEIRLQEAEKGTGLAKTGLVDNDSDSDTEQDAEKRWRTKLPREVKALPESPRRYIAHWRGINYYHYYFPNHQARRDFRRQELPGMFAPAVFDALGLFPSRILRSLDCVQDQASYLFNFLLNASKSTTRLNSDRKAEEEKKERAYSPPTDMIINLRQWYDPHRREVAEALEMSREKRNEEQAFRAAFESVESPFLSASAYAKHAVRYALGLKSSPLDEFFLLRPHYDTQGEPEHSYLGKVYIILQSVEEYEGCGAVNIYHAWAQGRIHTNFDIGYEEETTFFAFLQPSWIVYEMDIRAPSLRNGTYRNYYLEKYGLTLDTFNDLREKIVKATSDTDRWLREKEFLENYLQPHYEKLLRRLAQNEASQRGTILVRQDLNGSFVPEEEFFQKYRMHWGDEEYHQGEYTNIALEMHNKKYGTHQSYAKSRDKWSPEPSPPRTLRARSHESDRFTGEAAASSSPAVKLNYSSGSVLLEALRKGMVDIRLIQEALKQAESQRLPQRNLVHAPQGETPQYFKELPVLGDGNCGFTAMGVDRTVAVRDILGVLGNPVHQHFQNVMRVLTAEARENLAAVDPALATDMQAYEPSPEELMEYVRQRDCKVVCVTGHVADQIDTRSPNII